MLMLRQLSEQKVARLEVRPRIPRKGREKSMITCNQGNDSPRQASAGSLGFSNCQFFVNGFDDKGGFINRQGRCRLDFLIDSRVQGYAAAVRIFESGDILPSVGRIDVQAGNPGRKGTLRKEKRWV